MYENMKNFLGSAKREAKFVLIPGAVFASWLLFVCLGLSAVNNARLTGSIATALTQAPAVRPAPAVAIAVARATQVERR